MAEISEETLRGLLASLATGRSLVGPCERDGRLAYRPVSAETLILDDRLPLSSPKEFFFPQNEPVYTLRGEELIPFAPAKGVLLVGAKPCDLAGLAVLRAVLLASPGEDPLFAQRLAQSFLVGFGCAEEKPGCFCRQLGISPTFSPHCDLFFESIATGYQPVHASEAGRAVLAAHGMEPPPTAAQPPVPHVAKNTLALTNAPSETALFEAIDWEEATQNCLGCSLCTYLCPSCHCFGFRDGAQNGAITRYRCWDSCLSPRFTLHASGHNPRAQKYQRYRQRLLHKYYTIPKNNGLPGCTGCGRCTRSCPAGVDIAEMARKIAEVL